MKRFGPGPITDAQVATCRALMARSGVAVRIEDELAARRSRPGRPRALNAEALLCALLLLALDDRPLHLSAVTEVLFVRISTEAKESLGVVGAMSDQCTYLARYRQVRYLFSLVASVLDPSGLIKNRRLSPDELAARSVVLSENQELGALGRLEAFMGDLLCASVDEFDGETRPATLAYGLDATPVPLFSRGPSVRSGLCASDPDGGWYVRDGDHREREDHKGRSRGRVAWALEATVVTTASGEPGAVSAFPNLAIGLSLGRPGTDPGGTAVRLLADVVSRGFAPGPLGVDRAYSGALKERFHLPVRAMGFELVVDYRVDQLGRQANSHGAVMVEGTWYCPSMPEVLVNATIDLRAGRIDAETYQARIGARSDYALRKKSGPDADGYERFSCPARGPRPKVRCAIAQSSLIALGKRTVPEPPTDPPALCRQSAITIAPDVGARYAQSLSFGTEQWHRNYATLRNTIEGWNAFAKDTAHEALAQPGRRRVRGIAAQGILISMLFVAANLRKIDAHHAQMENLDSVQSRKRARRRRVSLNDYKAG
jgi:hypothetical protein